MGKTVSNKKLQYGMRNNTLTLDALHRSTLTDSGGINKYAFGQNSIESAIEKSIITLGGKNTVTGKARENVVEESSLTFTNSRNTVNLNGRESALDESTLAFKAGSNTVTLTGGEEAATGSRITFSGKGNRVTINGGDEALDESVVRSAGNDTFSLSARTVMDESSLAINGGNNRITLKGTTALEESSITTGRGADTLSITGSVIKGSRIDTGAGNDRVTLKGALSSSTLRTGSGNDTINLGNGSTLKGRAVIDGGSGRDVIALEAMNSVSLAGLVPSGTAVKGVEILSLSGGSTPTSLHVTGSALSRFTPDALTSGLKGQHIMRVCGDKSDTVTFAKAEQWAMVKASGKAGAAEYAIDGKTYNLWKNAAGKQVLVEKGVKTDGVKTDGGNPTGLIENKTLDYSGETAGRTFSLAATKGWSLKDSVLSFGKGNDKVTLAGGAASSRISLGNGNDTLTIGGHVTGKQLVSDARMDAAGTGWAKHVTFAQVLTGSGNDTVSITGELDNGVYISLGSGHNKLAVSKDVEYTKIVAESGNDAVTLRGDADDLIANLGDGKNSLTVRGDVEESIIQTGSGVDTITILGSLDDSSLSTGGGNDVVRIGEVENSTVNLGAGNDSLTVNGNFLGKLVAGNGNDTILFDGNLLKGSVIDLGTGNDTLSLDGMRGGSVTGGSGYDELVLHIENTAAPFSAKGEFSGLFSGNVSNARNFESLVLDMEDGSRDTLVLTQAGLDNLRKVASADGKNADAPLDLWVTGDAGARGDTVNVHGAKDFSAAGRVSHGGETYDHYTTDDGLDLYVQQSITLNFLG